uniref:Uncharacterized protein n=1 Tax=Caenorhabditis japonica TaxID=281687 RepID=A0A8R1I2J5_CAEJA
MKCNLLEASSCPETYYCSPAVPGAHWGFCCSVHIEASCPAESQPYIEHNTNIPVSVGYSCQSSQAGSLIGFCCTTPIISLRLPGESTVSQDVRTKNEKFLIHNEGLIGASVKQGPQKLAKKYQKVTKSTSTYGVVSNYKPPMCPPKSASVYYPNTQINIECTPAEGFEFECPESSSCVNAHLDLAGRMVCCEITKTTPTPNYVYYVTSTPRMMRQLLSVRNPPPPVRAIRFDVSNGILLPVLVRNFLLFMLLFVLTTPLLRTKCISVRGPTKLSNPLINSTSLIVSFRRGAKWCSHSFLLSVVDVMK